MLPSSILSWFQAQQACKNARKRLPSNAEWQAAVAGTPFQPLSPSPTGCYQPAGPIVANGSLSSCVSSDGAFEMPANSWEWVADWVPLPTYGGGECGGWSEDYTQRQCLLGAATIGEPAGIVRGFRSGGNGGLLNTEPIPAHTVYSGISFRCAR